MLNRRALIIGSPDDKIPGVKIDIVNYVNFLTSPLGGTWFQSELIVLENPDEAVVRRSIASLTTADYSMTIFAGHGSQPTVYSPVIAQINPNQSIDSNTLRIGASKHTLIMDCCRLLDRRLEERQFMANASGAMDSAMNTHSRSCYDREITAATPGIVVMCGCGINETSGESATQGGYYSRSLLQSAHIWQSNDRTDLGKYYNKINVIDVHNSAKTKVQTLSGNRQNPTIENPRTGPYFPFAINSA